MINHEAAHSKERRQHSTVLVPYSHYECRIPDLFMNVPMHWHSEFEINYILEGMGEFICGDDRFTACKGDIVIIPPNIMHSAHPVDDYLSYDAFVFSSDMLSYASRDRSTMECVRPLVSGFSYTKKLITSKDPFYGQVNDAVKNLFLHINVNSSISDLMIKSELYKLLWIFETNDCVKPYDQNRISYIEMIRPAIEFMNENYYDDISIENLAGIVNLSKSYFMNCFRKAVGMGSIEYLLQLRIREACKLLGDTSLTVSDISTKCGFNNLSNFNRQFKKIVGCSPVKYKKEVSD